MLFLVVLRLLLLTFVCLILYLFIFVATPSPEYKASILKESLSGTGTREGFLIDVICMCSNAELNAVKKIYATKYKGLTGHHANQLHADIKGDLSFNFKKVILACLEVGWLFVCLFCLVDVLLFV